jgi:hypothetical protein
VLPLFDVNDSPVGLSVLKNERMNRRVREQAHSYTFTPAFNINVERKSPVGAIGGYDGREAAGL